MAVMSTLMGWATIIAVALYLTHRYDPLLFRRLYQRLQPPAPTTAPAQPKKRKEKEKYPEPSRKRKIVSAPVEPVQAATTTGQKTTLPRDDDGDMGDREFARQLAAAQKGTQFQSKSGPVKERRTIKTGKAQESPSLSAGEADDDMSPVTSPTRPAGDVSDMLEPAPTKPTTLNITSIPESKPKQQPKQKQEQELTKKQRQRQAQKEENQRVQAAAAETEKKLREQQIRGARMAEGTSNQSKADKYHSTVWKPQTPALPQPVSTSAPLLDTFEPTSAPTNAVTKTNDENAKPSTKTDMPPPPKPVNGTARPTLSHQSSWADEVNEEAQEQYAQQVIEDAQWQEVTTKKSKKANRNVNDTSSEASANQAPTKAQNGTGQKGGAKVNGSAAGANGSAVASTAKSAAQAPRKQLNRFESIGDDSLDGW
jgi:hypothetical protein